MDSGSWTYHWCEGAKSPYLTYSSNGKITQLITYDDTKSLGYKIDLAKSRGIGGMMTWSYKGDDSSNSLKSKLAANINSSAITGGSGATFDVVLTNPGENSSSQMRLLWHSSASSSTLKYTVASDTSFSKATTLNLNGSINSTEAYYDVARGSYYTYKVTLNNLKPDTKYIYKITASGTSSATYSFKTAGNDGKFSFGWLADVHANKNEPAKVSNVDTLVNKMVSK
ncbi:MAG: hypothetical protein GX995_08715 [Clostridiales bacterium]|nr:hypothetical protein [Clostridiales bacterium]